ncbi:hypothetical protein BD413DRAFT_294003 [Trametes elegans]|nr:hypothetical protein BD413DRAFT_294003 [Trametes elegans]
MTGATVTMVVIGFDSKTQLIHCRYNQSSPLKCIHRDHTSSYNAFSFSSGFAVNISATNYEPCHIRPHAMGGLSKPAERRDISALASCTTLACYGQLTPRIQYASSGANSSGRLVAWIAREMRCRGVRSPSTATPLTAKTKRERATMSNALNCMTMFV